ncbi:hypothetical protein MMC19_001545 [Ptychographa xylographoides]|nr:hypothetical protein [Ptychographa xylographoides]
MMCASLSGISVSAPPAAEATPLETTTSMTTPAFSTTASETTEATSVRSLATSSSGVSVVSTSSSSSSMTSSRIQLASSVAVSVSSSEAVQTSSSSSSSSGSSSSVTGSVITIPVPVITRVVQQSISEGQPTLTSSVIGYSIETTSGTTSIATPSSSNSQIVKFTIFANDVAPPQSTSTSSLVFNLTGGGIIVVSNLTNISISTPSVTQPITTGGVAGGLLDRSMENSVGLHILLALLITFI